MNELKELKGASKEDLLKRLEGAHDRRDWASVRVLLELLGFKEHSSGDEGYIWGFTAGILEAYLWM